MSPEKAGELLKRLDIAVTRTLTGGNDPQDPGNVVEAIKEIAEVVRELICDVREKR